MSILKLNKKIVLASGSPRRQELLKLCVDEFTVCVRDTDESCACCDPAEYVKTLAERKARAVAKNFTDCVIIGADTVVVLGKDILGKPRSAEDAREMLSRLSGKSHFVYSGVAVLLNESTSVKSCKTEVFVAPLIDGEIDDYIKTGEPMDKAGAYAVQGLFAPFVQRIDGCYYNIMGLPLNLLSTMLRETAQMKIPK